MILNAIAAKLKRRAKDDFKGRHFEAALIVQAVSWYLRYPLSYRDIEEMLLERGLEVDHTQAPCERDLPADLRRGELFGVEIGETHSGSRRWYHSPVACWRPPVSACCYGTICRRIAPASIFSWLSTAELSLLRSCCLQDVIGDRKRQQLHDDGSALEPPRPDL